MSASTLATRRFRVAPSILALAAASGAAVCAWPQWHTLALCSAPRIGAGHLNLAIGLALLCGFFGSMALLAYSADPRAVAVTLLVVAALLSISVALVLSASGTYAIHWGADFPGHGSCQGRPPTEIHRVWYLYPVWGGAVALLLLQAVRALRYSRLAAATQAGDNDERE